MKTDAKVTSKGQITIPKSVRDRLGLRTGDQIEFIEEKGSFRVQKRLVRSPFGRYRGYLKALSGKDPDELVGQMRGP